MVHRFSLGLASESFWQLSSVLRQAPAPSVNPQSEYDMKAVYLYNLAMFVEWPPQSFNNSTGRSSSTFSVRARYLLR